MKKKIKGNKDEKVGHEGVVHLWIIIKKRKKKINQREK